MKLNTFGALGLALALAACAGNSDQGNTSGTGQDTSAQQSTNTGPVPGSEADLVASAGDRVFFQLNQNQLSSEARATLDKQASWLARYPQVNVMVAGNCDDRGTEEYNIALGQRRANAARAYLEAQGVNASRITTISYGKDRPSVDGDGEDAWAQNRNAITSVR
ncbi:peptidoglycan-associated lipoprotein Pal [Saccharibacter sp. 17.LH.SD]|uniref:peptidoglycan-associated lipoprotein Pal n=1 Tax=Saccharibacter sp. 17.LH.SD TaxID=2689393 RepID=UPI00136EEFAC|nr:peptidoglycan-associated lipoprotein Pal [Saccharibacter sp. 17.LH.SD]MXV43988.1 peptidoglycan-associated lipoprotein Pal [Saccharibacter sp. 17.LH.SD]